MDEAARDMENHAMPSHAGFRSGHFHEGSRYETRRPAGARDWLLILTLDGVGFHRYQREVVTLPPGTALLYGPGVPQHYGTHRSGHRWELIWAHFPETASTEKLAEWPTVAGGAGVLDLAGIAGPTAEAMHELVEWQRGGSVHRHAFAENALERALLWCHTVNPRGVAAEMDPRVAQAREIISARLDGRIDVATIATEVGLSPSRLSHLFKRHTGRSVPAYVEQRRMERAEDLLRMTGRSVSEVARAVGYDDPLYFSRRFRVRTGTSPRLWRAAVDD
jgi:AraC family transcriptional regulator, arabinose operon regulatory protein